MVYYNVKHAKQTKLLFLGESQLAEDVSSTVVDPCDCLIVQVSTELILQEFDSLVQGGTVLAPRHAGIHQGLNININFGYLQSGALLEPLEESLKGAEGAVVATMDTIQDTFRDLNLEMILESLADLLECGTLVISAEGRAGHGGGDEDAENEELPH